MDYFKGKFTVCLFYLTIYRLAIKPPEIDATFEKKVHEKNFIDSATTDFHENQCFVAKFFLKES